MLQINPQLQKEFAFISARFLAQQPGKRRRIVEEELALGVRIQAQALNTEPTRQRSACSRLQPIRIPPQNAGNSQFIEGVISANYKNSPKVKVSQAFPPPHAPVDVYRCFHTPQHVPEDEKPHKALNVNKSFVQRSLEVSQAERSLIGTSLSKENPICHSASSLKLFTMQDLE
ncbi:hypothetical protein SS50377_27865 [Spironucleus salmonicida]|uniref:Uncharacterized protein n=1 Tax=Spironucleus salmonicida TaxID=348837 RepID=V6M623_9EUKA|nr:hypothetical protein SS50377_27865 [Spironucleus salmonicida]|eukprot:EST48819.1 Hypothetical protein SS50377_10914 [Spironucleus salmonicida]